MFKDLRQCIIERYFEPLARPDVECWTHEMTIDERMERLTGIVESLAATVVAHDNQLEILIAAVEKHERAIEDMRKQ
jgi:hypothetical protein